MVRRIQDLVSKVDRNKSLLADLLLEKEQVDIYPASLAQERLWFLNQLNGESSAYNVHLGLWLNGPLDLRALLASLQEMAKRHDSLRMSFRLEGSDLHQVVARNLTLNVPFQDLTLSPEPWVKAYRLAQREVETPFHLDEAPLFRASIFRTTAEDHVLLCTMPHIVTDSWSVQILARELAIVYEALSAGKASPLADLPIGYGDYSEWQRKWLGSDQVRRQLSYWSRRLENAPPVIELPTDSLRPSEQTFHGSSETLQLSADTVNAIKVLAARWQATPFMLLLAAFKILIYRYSGQTDLLIGVPVAGRSRVETENLVGFFVNTLVLRDDLSGNPSFPNLVAQVRETTLSAFANADVPFEKIVEVIKPERTLSYNPVFQIMFSMIKSAVRSTAFGTLTATPYVVTTSTSIFDLSATLIEAVDGHWWTQIDYNTDLFDSKRIRRMLDDYHDLLERIVVRPEESVMVLAASGAHSKQGLLAERGRAAKTRATVLSSATSAGKRAPTRQPSEEEQLLIGVWEHVLGVTGIGIYDNFFDVGGHSLLGARVIAEIEQATNRKIPVSAVFRAPTIESFSRLLTNPSAEEPDPIVIKLNEGEGVPVFLVARPGVDSSGFVQLARYLAPRPAYKIQASSSPFWGRPFTREELQETARDYIAAMQLVQPHGPYCLGGMCEGLLFAQEMIVQLESQGKEVALLAIFDTWVMENSQIRWLAKVDYYSQRLRRLRSLPLNEKFATARSTLSRWFVPGSKTIGDGWANAFWPGSDFRPPRFRAPILLLKRPRQPYFRIRDPQMGWGQRSLGGVEIREIECGHFEMLREPHVRLVAQALAERMTSASARDNETCDTTSSPKPASSADSGPLAESVA